MPIAIVSLAVALVELQHEIQHEARPIAVAKDQREPHGRRGGRHEGRHPRHFVRLANAPREVVLHVRRRHDEPRRAAVVRIEAADDDVCVTADENQNI